MPEKEQNEESQTFASEAPTEEQVNTIVDETMALPALLTKLDDIQKILEGIQSGINRLAQGEAMKKGSKVPVEPVEIDGAKKYSAEEVVVLVGEFQRTYSRSLFFIADDEEVADDWWPLKEVTLKKGAAEDGKDALTVPIWLLRRKIEEKALKKSKGKKEEIAF